MSLLLARIDRQTARRPDAIAVVAGNRQLSYAALDREARRLAAALGTVGIGPDDVVGVAIERSVDLTIAFLAILRTGAGFLPLDPGQPDPRLAAMVEDAGPRLILASEDHRARACRFADTKTLAELRPDGGAEAPDTVSERDLPAPHPASAAYFLFTSGTTGRPKCVVNTHAGLDNRIAWMERAYRLEPGERVLQKTPTSFDVSVWEFFWPLFTGGTVVMARPGGHRDIPYLIEEIRRQAIARLHFVPSMLDAFIQELDRPLPGLRQIVASGEALPAPLAALVRRKLPGASLDNLYGPTEAAIDVTAHRVSDADRTEIPIGTPIDGVAIRLVDRRSRPVPDGERGELCIAGIALARGYLGRPDLTAERFVPDPQSALPGGRMYRTGDLARMRADGAILYAGRMDDQVKINGQRVEPLEVEAVLRAAPRVGGCAVVVARGRGAAPSLRAYLQPEQGGGWMAGEDFAWLAARAGDELAEPANAARWARINAEAAEVLSDYMAQALPGHMRPAELVIVPRIPTTANGKADRALLPAPPRAAHEIGNEALTDEEALLVDMWRDLLGAAANRSDSFLQSGGDSVQAIRLAARLHARGYRIGADDILAAPTLAALAAMMPGSRNGPVVDDETVPAVPGQADVVMPGFAAGMVRETALWPGSGVNIEQLSFAIRDLDPVRWREAWIRVAGHHRLMTGRFHPRSDDILHHTDREADPFEWREDDLSAWSIDRRDAWWEAMCAEDFARAPNLFGGPISIMRCVRWDAARWRCLWTLPHALTDGWSFQIVLEDVWRAYEGHALEAAGDYADFARWLADHPIGAADAAYWRDALRQDPIIPERSTAVSGPVIRRYETTVGGRDGLMEAARSLDVSEFALIQAAWIAAVGEGWPGARHGVLHAVRPPSVERVERIVGPLFSVLPVSAEVARGATISALARNAANDQRAKRNRLNADPVRLACLAGRERLGFDAILVFENTPPIGAPYHDLIVRSRFNQPLVALVWPEAGRMRIEICCDETRVDAAHAEALTARFADILGKGRSIADLRCGSPEPDLLDLAL